MPADPTPPDAKDILTGKTVKLARDDSPDGAAARRKLWGTYAPLVQEFFRSFLPRDPDSADDLTNDFLIIMFAVGRSGKAGAATDPKVMKYEPRDEAGAFRKWLYVAARNFLCDRHQFAAAKFRQPVLKAGPIRDAGQVSASPPADHDDPPPRTYEEFTVGWAARIVAQALEALWERPDFRIDYAWAKNLADRLGRRDVSLVQWLATTGKMSPADARQRLLRLRARLRPKVNELVAEEGHDPDYPDTLAELVFYWTGLRHDLPTAPADPT
jgi:hypothetical protein